MTRTTVVIADGHVLVRQGLKMLLSAEADLEVVADTGDGAEVEALGTAPLADAPRAELGTSNALSKAQDGPGERRAAA